MGEETTFQTVNVSNTKEEGCIQYITLTAVVYEIILLISFTQKESCYFSITVIKVKGQGMPVLNHAHAMKAYEEVEEQCHTFFILLLDKGEWSAFVPQSF